MNARTTVTDSGDIALPRDVRERLAWTPGMQLEIVETGNGLRLSPAAESPFPRKTLADLRALPRAQGPRQSVQAISRLSDGDIRRLTE